MISKSETVGLDQGGVHSFSAPYGEIGMRLSGTADQPAATQYDPQALFEFGYGSDGAGHDGTAYNLSLFVGSAGNVRHQRVERVVLLETPVNSRQMLTLAPLTL